MLEFAKFIKINKYNDLLAPNHAIASEKLGRVSQVNFPSQSRFDISQKLVQATQALLAHWRQCENRIAKWLRHETILIVTGIDLFLFVIDYNSRDFLFYYDFLFINQLSIRNPIMHVSKKRVVYYNCYQ